MLGARGHIRHEKIFKIWGSLVRFGVYFDQMYLEKFIYFYIKNNYYSYSHEQHIPPTLRSVMKATQRLKRTERSSKSSTVCYKVSDSSSNFGGKTCHN